jgi:hypothetical protein
MFASRRSHIALLTIIGALVAAATAAPGASAAAQRYASPNGAGNECSSEKPCTVVWAIQGAADGDEVIVKPGDYAVGYTIENTAPVSIHGVEGQPRPKLYLNSASLLRLTDARLSYVEVVQNSAATVALGSTRSKLDQVIVRGGQQADCAGVVYNSALRNSIVVARNPSGEALCAPGYGGANASILLNVTAIAQSGAAIAAWDGDPTGAVDVQAVNVIAKAGPTGAGFEAKANVGGHATISVLHSNYAKFYTYGAAAQVKSVGGNQSFAPAFVDEAAGDYRQKPWSPTIDAGHDDAKIGFFDVDGDPRDVGTTDIGADEYVPVPAATTGPASAVTDQAGTLAGTVNSKGATTSYRFEYGPTTAYGSSTSDSDAGSGLTDVPASASVAGLAPETTYHYRVVASNAGGVVYGADQTFTTAAAATQASPSFSGVKLISSKLVLTRRGIVVRLSCPAGTAGTCTGVTKLSTRRRSAGSGAAATVRLGRAGFSITAGAQAKVRVRLSRAGRRLFRHTRRVRGRAATAAHDAAGLSKATIARVSIRKG